MSETFGLTGVEVESRVPVTAKAEPPKKIVTATVPKVFIITPFSLPTNQLASKEGGGEGGREE